jgi:hypothetical protein
MARGSSHLVTQHIERIPRRILEDHPRVLREYVKGKRGVYALYKKSRLYYVGLASNLRTRLKAHLRDRHADAWDFFSLYLTTRDDHLRELEALVLRITMPSGNKSKTKFAKSTDLRRSFKKRIVESQRSEIEELFGARKAIVRRLAPSRARSRRGEPALAGFITKRTPIRMTNRGKVYRATILKDGRVRYRARLFMSPSMAAKAVAGNNRNGWYWWKYQASPGDWQRLKTLRTR